MTLNTPITKQDLSNSYTDINEILLQYSAEKNSLSLEKMETIRARLFAALVTTSIFYQELSREGQTTNTDAARCKVELIAGMEIIKRLDKIIERWKPRE